jgi:arsenate reductase (thioredoxin)
MDKARVLFLCTGNSARSQMAEAFLKRYAPQAFEAHSAGLEPAGIHPLTVKVMEEEGIDMGGHRSKGVNEYMGKMLFGYLITVCGHADANCPSVFPGVGKRMHWEFDDPAAFTGTEDERMREFRRVRDQIRDRVLAWLREQGIEPVR